MKKIFKLNDSPKILAEKRLIDCTDDELYAELELRKISAKEVEYKNWHTKKSPKGVKVSDLLVIKNKIYETDKKSFYGLALKKKWKKKKQISDDWEEYSDWAELLPDDFGEAVENGYEFDGTDEEAEKILKKCGFEVIQRNW